MTNITKIGNHIVLINMGDHNPPHVHITGAGVDVVVFLKTDKVLGNAKEAKKAIKWVNKNKTKLLKIWKALND